MLFLSFKIIIMTYPQIIKDLKAKKYASVYLLHGDETFYIDVILKLELRRKECIELMGDYIILFVIFHSDLYKVRLNTF